MGESLAVGIPQKGRTREFFDNRHLKKMEKKSFLRETLEQESSTRHGSKQCDGQGYKQPFQPSKLFSKDTQA